MSLLLLFPGVGGDGWTPPKKDGVSRLEYQQKLARLNREDDEIMAIIIAWVLKDG